MADGTCGAERALGFADPPAKGHEIQRNESIVFAKKFLH